MKFIILLIALALLRYWGSARPLHNDGLFHWLWRQPFVASLPASLQLVVVVLLPAAAVAWLLSVSQGLVFGLLSIALGVVFLLYSLGRGDFSAVVHRYEELCEAGNFEGACLYAATEPVLACLPKPPGEAERLHRWMKDAIAYLGLERWFAPIFYFALLGPAGAVAYRLLQLAGREAISIDADAAPSLAARLLHLVEWLPARVLVFTFAITGDWVGSREQVSSSLLDLDTPTEEALGNAAHASLGLKSTVFSEGGDLTAIAQVSAWEIRQLHNLISRSVIAWVVAISLLVLLT
jgi:AmpE protein